MIPHSRATEQQFVGVPRSFGMTGERATERGIERVPRYIGMTGCYLPSMNENFPASELATLMDSSAGLQ